MKSSSFITEVSVHVPIGLLEICFPDTHTHTNTDVTYAVKEYGAFLNSSEKHLGWTSGVKSLTGVISLERLNTASCTFLLYICAVYSTVWVYIRVVSQRLTREGEKAIDCVLKRMNERKRENREGGNYLWRCAICRSRHAGRFLHASRAVNQL